MWVSLKEYAELNGLEYFGAYNRIKKGLIKAPVRRHYRQWQIWVAPREFIEMELKKAIREGRAEVAATLAAKLEEIENETKIQGS
ncbi:MAG TPA: hypothetical protein VKV18_01095 [Chthonomonas sp.]|uniref:hypothetical protein n=1 Tax=Chthonomonas sp. TaxID=2282153 RepID=UPI002B4ACBCD|nr:hypothetical protein [Chthonomonas sp.]HLI47275.1 hypothetical protein [Chthonomonas sp.]